MELLTGHPMTHYGYWSFTDIDPVTLDVSWLSDDPPQTFDGTTVVEWLGGAVAEHDGPVPFTRAGLTNDGVLTFHFVLLGADTIADTLVLLDAGGVLSEVDDETLEDLLEDLPGLVADAVRAARNLPEHVASLLPAGIELPDHVRIATVLELRDGHLTQRPLPQPQ